MNRKRMYRVMKAQGLLLPKSPRRRESGRAHYGKVMVEELNQRRCSDGFEIAGDNGGVVIGAFLKDCCEREVIAWRAWIGRGLPRQASARHDDRGRKARFGSTDERVITVEFLSD